MPQLYESNNDVFSLLPVKFYKHDLTGNQIQSPLHWHRSIEITVTLSGRIHYNTSSNNFDFGESDWIIINSGELHSCRYINPADHFSGISIIISLPFIEKWLGENLFFYNPQDEILTAQIKVIAQELFALNTETPNSSLILMSRLYEILHLLVQHCIKTGIRNSTLNADMKLANVLTDYIENHYQESIRLQSVAEHFKYSPSHFSRLFKKTLGVNFHTYLNFVRVHHAAEQLADKKMNITECALNNGFPNTKSFIHIFREIFGCTPGYYISNSLDTFSF